MAIVLNEDTSKVALPLLPPVFLKVYIFANQKFIDKSKRQKLACNLVFALQKLFTLKQIILSFVTPARKNYKIKSTSKTRNELKYTIILDDA